MDLGWVFVEFTSVGYSFDAVAVGVVSLDHPRICSVSSQADALLGDLVDCFGEGGDESVRGKTAWLGTWRRIAR